ncbi:DUF5018 domain-containing protein [Mariniflexile ostreae]|uniref:DUF5018 domain-containing protein n=1 Tax=Mariniflexile ostreae TaxID=1520892 RepID=A0ABV5FC82_9FLAO
MKKSSKSKGLNRNVGIINDFELKNVFELKWLVVVLFLIPVFSCSSSPNIEDEIVKSSSKQITSFIFTVLQNGTLVQDIHGVIDEDAKTVKLTVPYGTNVSALVPSISMSDKVSIIPNSGKAQDFRNPIKYSVIAEDASVVFYTVSVGIDEIANGSLLQVGDPGVQIDQSKFDENYPQMSRWAKAGVEGGIPFIDSFEKTSSIMPGNSESINAAISSLSAVLENGEKGLITLKEGMYTIDASVIMKSNVSLIGESRDGVVCSISMNGGDAFSFNNVQKCGLYNLTITGSWSEPKYNWNYGIPQNREFTNDNISVRLKSGTKNCWLDNVQILNSARDPLRCPADHNTFRNLIIDGCKRKSGGAEGYFFIQGRDNLITGCQVTRIRHISLQGDNVEYNVVYNNDFRQEISFHSGDNGNNLIEFNRITLPSDMPPIEAGETGPYPETENGKPIYFAIMGPWSTQHTNSANPNFIYRNDCKQFNHNYGTNTPWSNANQVYFGPEKLGLSIQERIDNFPEYDKGVPSGGTLYAVKL